LSDVDLQVSVQSSASLDALLSPKSMAIVGATPDPAKLNSRVIRFLQERGYRGKIYPVNPKYDEVLGLECFASLADIPGPVDMALIAVPAHAVAASVREAAQSQAKVALIFASGFAELGEEGRKAQAELTRFAKENGIRLLGPNTVGVVNAYEGVLATFSQIGNNPVNPGPVVFVTQSGAIGTVVNTLANKQGMGLGYLVHTGNEADIDFVESMAALIENDRVTVGTGYLEGVRDGKALCELGLRAMELGKPLVLIKVGQTQTGALAAASHTGALASEDRIYDAVTRQHGILRARTEGHMLSLAEGLARLDEPKGSGIAFISQSGGAAVQMTDMAEELGLAVPELCEATQAELREILPSFASFRNPVDASMQAVADPSLLTKGMEIILRDPAVDLGVIWLQHMDARRDEIIELFEGLRAVSTKPWVAAWAATPDGVQERLRGSNICVLGSAEQAIECCAASVKFGAARRRSRVPASSVSQSSAALEPGRALGTVDVAGCLREAGVPVADVKLAADRDEAVRAAEMIGYPVAVKIESPQILHKSEAKGVVLGLNTPEEVAGAFDRVVANAKQYMPGATVLGAIVQKMETGHAELVVGLRHDPTFGMLVMAGLGGIFVEVLEDVAFRRAPITPEEANAMLDELKGKRVLDGVRGRPAVDKQALADLISRVSAFGAANENAIAEMDLNPVLATERGLVVVDWLLAPRTANLEGAEEK